MLSGFVGRFVKSPIQIFVLKEYTHITSANLYRSGRNSVSPYKDNLFATVSPIANDDVAAGEGALQTCTIFLFSTK